MRFHRFTLLAVAAAFGLSGGSLHAAAPRFGEAEVLLCGRAAPPRSLSACGFSLVAGESGPQAAFIERPSACIVCVQEGEEVSIAVPLGGVTGPLEVSACATARCPGEAEVCLSLDGRDSGPMVLREGALRLEARVQRSAPDGLLHLRTTGRSDESAVRWHDVRLTVDGRSLDVPVLPRASEFGTGPPPVQPAMRKPIEQALVEHDWRMQDGIDTERVPSTYAAAIERTLQRGDALIRDLQAGGVPLQKEAAERDELRRRWKERAAANRTSPSEWEALWRRVHALRRQIVLRNPLARVGPLLFVKRVPSAFSHQLTQYYGRDARPGGGIFVLDAPGRSMRCRQLAAGVLPVGSYQHPEVAYDGRRVLFSYCPVDTSPRDREAHGDHYYHLYEMAADGSQLRQLTDGPYDDFSPRDLPDGEILFVSTRRGGFHRCGRGPCPVYTLSIAGADGSHPHPISYHETHEWDPAVLGDGRVIYTRWDYVDRHAVHYEQLWSVRPDGSDVRIFYGNNTFNPVGVWEARPVPNSRRVMATAGAHHAMTAGSIILLDVTRGIDGLDPITRLTPDALFPESEVPVIRQTGGFWHAPVGVPTPPPVPPEAARWPGHCYRTPYPLSEKYFLAAYSFEALIGEPTGNPVNMFGICLVDCFGNKELLYRDLNIGSLWPTPIRPRPKPLVVAAVSEEPDGDGGGSPAALGAGLPTSPQTVRGQETRAQRAETPAQGAPAVAPVSQEPDQPEGIFFLRDVYESWPALERGTIKRLRIVEVVLKSTPHINNPPVGIPNASPGKQVLGTVPVEPDGSACFRVPAGIPVAFQALDELGQAVQMMRSVTYLQPGERVSCVGCHEPRTTAPPRGRLAQALCRPPSTLAPGPDGSHPLSYPILVQPVLDRHCVRCHSRDKPEGDVVLTGEPEGRYTVSYNALAPKVAYSAWGGRGGDFRQVNSEPLTQPGHFGARGSPLMKLLREGHEDVSLGQDEMDRLVTWMDANALFYGTFDPHDQARQQRGERIEGPAL